MNISDSTNYNVNKNQGGWFFGLKGLGFGLTVLLLLVLSLPFEIYNFRFLGLGWSLDRFLLLILLCVIIFEFMKKSGPIWGLLITMLLILVATFSTLAGGTLFSAIGTKYLPSYIQCYLLFFCTYTVLYKNPRGIRMFQAVMLPLGVIIMLFGVYSFIHFYILDVRFFSPPFMPDHEWGHHKMAMLRYRRIFWPFPTAQAYGFISAIVGVILLGNHLIARSRTAFLLSASLFFLCIFTLSRSSILMLAFSLSVLLFFGLAGKSRKVKCRYILSALSIVVLAIVMNFVRSYFSEEKGYKSVERIENISLQDSSLIAHLEARKLGLESYLSHDFSGKVIGSGPGSSWEVIGFSSPHMSYVTVLLEQGFLGALLFCMVTLVPVFVFGFHVLFRKNRSGLMAVCFAVAVGVFISHSFYNVASLRFLWVFSGFLFAYKDTWKSLALSSHGNDLPPRV